MLSLSPNVYYPEDELVTGLGVARKWLRRTVGGLRGGRTRVYRGGDVLEKLCPCPTTALPSTSVKAPRFGGRDATSEAKEGANEDGPLGSGSTTEGGGSLVAWARNELRNKPSVAQLKPSAHPRKKLARRSEP